MHLQKAVSLGVSSTIVFLCAHSMAVAATFQDVHVSHPHYEAVRFAQNNGIVNGYPDAMFKPDQTINRAELVKIVVGFVYKDKQQNIEMCPPDVHGTYVDVPPDAWYGHFLCRARDDHIVGGYPDKTFRPDQPISFVEAAKIIANGLTVVVDPAKYEDGVDAQGKSFYKYNGREFPERVVNPWYKGYVDWLATYNAIPLDITSFDQHVTRGQVAEMLYRIVERLSKDSQSYDSIGAASWFSDTNVCSDPPVRGLFLDSDALSFPNKAEYAHLGYIGELLTAEDCGPARLAAFIGNEQGIDSYSGYYPFIVLKEPAAAELLSWLEQVGFESKDGAVHAGIKWEHPSVLQIKTLLEIRKYTHLIDWARCPNCYGTRPSD